MQKYEAIRPLYEFLAVSKNRKKHSRNDNFGLTTTEFMDQNVMEASKATMGAVQYVVLSCDEVFIVDNQSWLFVHCYVVQNWARIIILISLDILFEGSNNDNQTKVIMEALTIGGGCQEIRLLKSSFSLG